GRDVEATAELSLEEAFHGTTRTVQLHGSVACATCGGSGQVASALCHTCQGSGQAARQRRIEVKIPPGVRTGSRVRAAAEGDPGAAGGPSGDLFVLVTVQPHPRFERKGDDLHTEVEVQLLAAVLGGEVNVPTIDGQVALKLPELTQNGKSFRLSGKGMPGLGNPDRRGDLYARVRVRLPEKLTADQKVLFEQLRQSEEVVAHG
ncbi:MAG: DnaJ C-terminal domain-containing protein, partial [Dehalococcoidia bacterium]